MCRSYRFVLLLVSVVGITACQHASELQIPLFENYSKPEPVVASENVSLTTLVSEALQSSPELAPYHIQVESHADTVVLSGYVKTIRQSDTAGDLAAKVMGVHKVDNNIIVRKWLK